ncbi:hypothetical protein HDU99_002724, partial [Rhizoclosmatium hyalinum]
MIWIKAPFCLALLAVVCTANDAQSDASNSTTTNELYFANVTNLPPSYYPPSVFDGPEEPKAHQLNTAAGIATHLSYSGGPIIREVVVQPIFYGSVSYASQIAAFYKGVTQSAWMDLLAQYGTWGGSSLNPIYVTPTMDYSKGYLSDQDIRNYLIGLVRSGTISPNVNAYFPIHFQPGIRALTNDNNVVQLSCQDFCGYHSAIDLSHPANDAGIDFNSNKQTQFLYYGVLPDITNPNCHCRDLLNRGVFADTLAVAAHELAEAVTDSVPNMLAWHDFTKNVDGEEVADLCSWQMDKTVSRYDGLSYDVHLLWSNNDVNCVATGSTALAYPAITTGCYQAYDKSRPYAVGSVASALSNG